MVPGQHPHQESELESRCLLDLHLYVRPEKDKSCGGAGTLLLCQLSRSMRGGGDPMWVVHAIVSVVTCVIKSPGAGQEEVRSKAGFEHSWTLLSRSPGKE